jgi:hypothetical protein
MEWLRTRSDRTWAAAGYYAYCWDSQTVGRCYAAAVFAIGGMDDDRRVGDVVYGSTIEETLRRAVLAYDARAILPDAAM